MVLRMNERLKGRALAYFRLWAMVALWTLLFSEGAGFGAATYQNVCAPGQHGICPLVYQPLFPPSVPVHTFIGYLASFWFDGLYDVGLLFALIAIISLLLVASRMTQNVAERVFSLPLIALGGIGFVLVGYFFEVHKTLSTGVAGVPQL